MFCSELFGFTPWWILFPIIMIVFCVLMMLMMRGRMGCMMDGMMDGHQKDEKESRNLDSSDSAMDILDRRYALGEINKEEYEEKKQALRGHV